MFYEFINKLWSKTEGINISLLLSTNFYDIYDAYRIDMYNEMLKYDVCDDRYTHYKNESVKCKEISIRLKMDWI